jgi:hypothetical protein
MEVWNHKLVAVREHSSGLGKTEQMAACLANMIVRQCCFEVNSTGWRDHQIMTRNKACINLSTALIPLVRNMVQQKVINYHIMLVLDCVDENIPEVDW